MVVKHEMLAGRKRERSAEDDAPSNNWSKLKAKLPRRQAADITGAKQEGARADGAIAASSSLAAAPQALAPAASVMESARLTIRGPWTSGSMTPDEASIVALDCEMVGVGPGGLRSALAQVVMVDYFGRPIFSTYVRVAETVTDFRTAVSGVRPEHLRDAPPFAVVQQKVAALVRGKMVVGHALRNDMRALLLSHPWRNTRDTALYKPFCRRARGGHMKPRRLKHLVKQHLGMDIQTGEHAPEEDARAALALYKLFRREWEASLKTPQPGKATDARSASR